MADETSSGRDTPRVGARPRPGHPTHTLAGPPPARPAAAAPTPPAAAAPPLPSAPLPPTQLLLRRDTPPKATLRQLILQNKTPRSDTRTPSGPAAEGASALPASTVHGRRQAMDHRHTHQQHQRCRCARRRHARRLPQPPPPQPSSQASPQATPAPLPRLPQPCSGSYAVPLLPRGESGCPLPVSLGNPWGQGGASTGCKGGTGTPVARDGAQADGQRPFGGPRPTRRRSGG